MAVTIVRATVLYLTVTVMIRLMGKRQIGELQPSELVITMLISEIAAIPMQDNTIPVLNSVAAVFILVAFEIIISVINMKSIRFRGLTQGHPVTVIRDGNIDMNALKELRVTLPDLLGALREKNVFDISTVSYAIFETDGKISVMLKPQFKNVTAGDMNLFPKDNGMQFAVVCDGKIVDDALRESGRDENFIKNTLKSHNISLGSITVMTVDGSGNVQIIGKGTDK